MIHSSKLNLFLVTGLAVMCFLMLSLSPKNDAGGVSPEEFKEFYKSHQSKFLKQNTVNDINYTVQFIPVELKILKANSIKVTSDEVIRQMYVDYKNSYEFLVQIEANEFKGDILEYPSLKESYNDRLSYLSFEMKNDIKFVLDQQDTINCAEYLYERNFGMSPKASITIGFETKKSFKTLDIIINDKLFQTNNLRFEFNTKDIKLLPKLKKSQKWKK